MNNQNIALESSGTLFLVGGVFLRDILGYISLILGILISCIAIGKTIYSWLKKSKQSDSDGGEKITKNEILNLIKDIISNNGNDVKNISNSISKIKEENKDERQSK